MADHDRLVTEWKQSLGKYLCLGKVDGSFISDNNKVKLTKCVDR